MMSVRKIITNNSEVRWEVRVYLDGRRSKEIRRRFVKRAEADAFEVGFQDEKRKLSNADVRIVSFEETTFQAEAENWLERQGLVFSPGHLKRVKWVLTELLPKFGNLTPNQLHPDRLSLYQSEQLRSGLSPASVNRKTEVITAILNFSAKLKRIPYNPSIGFEKLPENREDMRFWERPEAEGFLAFANNKYPRDSEQRWKYVVYLLALNTGLRSGEIWGLKPLDIMHEGHTLYVRRQWDLVAKDFRLPKGKKARFVPCNSELFQELKQLIQSRNTAPDKTVFHSRNGTPTCHDNFDDGFREDVKESGQKVIRFHDMRHTATTLMIADGLDLKTVQVICGHQNVSTTMNYVHLLGDSIKNAAKTFAVRPNSSLRLIVNQ